MPLIK